MISKEEILKEVFGHAYGTLHPLMHVAPFGRAMDEYAKEVHWAYKKWIEKIVEDDGLRGQYKYMTDEQLFDEFLKTIA